jgi:hypothetical protein
MNLTHSPRRRGLALAAATLSATGVAGVVALTLGLTAASGATTSVSSPARHDSFSFLLKPSPHIAACLPHAGGRVTITPNSLNDTMTVSVHGMPPGSGFDLFVIQQPNKPFGVAWYQTDVNVGRDGDGTATVRGVFSVETFSVSAGGTTKFTPTHQYHLGLWFNNPTTPFNLGCEPGMSAPVVTPFNGEQHAGVQALNTAQFPVNRGPLSHVN